VSGILNVFFEKSGIFGQVVVQGNRIRWGKIITSHILTTVLNIWRVRCRPSRCALKSDVEAGPRPVDHRGVCGSSTRLTRQKSCVAIIMMPFNGSKCASLFHFQLLMICNMSQCTTPSRTSAEHSRKPTAMSASREATAVTPQS
jgi:hypothetical protein